MADNSPKKVREAGGRPKIVGLAGTVSSGKEVAAVYLRDVYHSRVVRLSSILEAELQREKRQITRRSLQDLGNELRQRRGSDILVRLATQDLTEKERVVVIDGIRNLGEVTYLRNKFGRNFILVGVDAPARLRYRRFVRRAKTTDPKSWGEFQELDKRDHGFGEPEFEQQTGQCVQKANIRVVNASGKRDFLATLAKSLSPLLSGTNRKSNTR